ncbi:MAG: MBL fold metallo-hydrolase [bacterium]
MSRFLDGMFNSAQMVKPTVTQPILPTVGLSALWIGHSSVLVQIEDKVFLTDPVFSNTIGMLAPRAYSAGLDPRSISKVDVVLISHLHMDHFAFGSIDQLPKHGMLVLPPGGSVYSPDFGFKETVELKTWTVYEQDGIRITAVPVMHFSGRYGFDSQWQSEPGYGGYVVEYKGRSFFYPGDTGYRQNFFQEIGERFRIDLAILPIGPAGSADRIASRIHAGPLGALEILKEVKGKYMIPVHYMAFFQGFEATPTRPREVLDKTVKERGMQERVFILEIGEQKIIIP